MYFNKLVDTIMFLLRSKRFSPFGRYRIKDYFKRIEFQQRGSPHAHILLWLENDPQETISEYMPRTVELLDELCSVDPDKLQYPHNQTHKHTFTCYKKARDENDKKCRFMAPFWPMHNTCVLIPMAKYDSCLLYTSRCV